MSEKELVRKIITGDEKAFKELIDDYKTMIVGVCYGFTHHLEEAEDLAQDVFVQAYESLNSFRFECKLSTWLYQIAVHKSSNYCKSFHRKRIRLNLEEFNRYATIPSDELSMEERMDIKEQLQRLHQAMDELPDNQRKAIILNKYENLSQKEVAEILHISVKAVESLISRAKANLEKRLRLNSDNTL